jgi:Ca2+/Na+ antiporter
MKIIALLFGTAGFFLFVYLVYLFSKHKAYFSEETEYQKAFSRLRENFPQDAFVMKWGLVFFFAVEAIGGLIAMISKY